MFVRHTSASLVIYENADPSAREDLHRYFEKIAPEDDEDYVHTLEGPDDTTSHLRMALTRTSGSGANRAGADDARYMARDLPSSTGGRRIRARSMSR